MVDVLLMQALMKAVPDHAALLIVGDSGFATSPIAKTFSALVSCCELTTM